MFSSYYYQFRSTKLCVFKVCTCMKTSQDMPFSVHELSPGRNWLIKVSTNHFDFFVCSCVHHFLKLFFFVLAQIF